MNVGISYRELLPPNVAEELETMSARIRQSWFVEHDADGHHGDLTAQTIYSDGLIAAGSDPLQGTATTFAKKLRVIHLSNSSSGSETVGSALIQQLVATVGSAQGLGSAARAAHASGVVTLIIGGGGGASVIGNGSASNARGVQATVHTESGSGGITDARAVYAAIPGRISGTGTITNAYGVYVDFPGGAGITNKFGVYVSDTAAVSRLPIVEIADGTAPGPSLRFLDNTNTGIYSPATNEVGLTGGGTVGLIVGSGYALLADGSAGAPSLSFISDTNLGLYRVSADVLGFASTTNFFSGPILAGSSTGGTAGTTTEIEIPARAKGTGAVFGGLLFIGHNTSGSDAAGALGMGLRGGAVAWIWTDATGVVRVGGAPPTENNTTVSDTSGTVVGTQVSAKAFKTAIRRNRKYADMLRAVLDVPLYDFRYKNGAFPDAHFTGLITDSSPLFGMDADTEHPGGKSLNEVTCIGYLMGAVKALNARIVALETTR